MRIRRTDILAVKSGVIVHQVNAKGVMGAGLALAIRMKWPRVWQAYKAHTPRLGQIQIVKVGPDLYVCNLCGQDGYGRTGRYTDYDAVRTGLEKLSRWAVEHGVGPIYIPYRMGCGLGGGNWDIISAVIAEVVPQAVVIQRLKKGGVMYYALKNGAMVAVGDLEMVLMLIKAGIADDYVQA